MGTHRPRHLGRVIAWSAAGVALAAVFLSYLRPELMFDLATRVWSCF